MSHVIEMRRPKRTAIAEDVVTVDREALVGVLRLLMRLIEGRPPDPGEQGTLLRTTLRLSLIVCELLQERASGEG